jgi:ABC-type transport system involved in multi-copper enzyme maturation permease subunit
MRITAILAINFLREQRIFLLVMSGYLLLGAGVLLVNPGTNEDDLAFLVKQQATYAAVIGVFMTSGMMNTERRSRRILAVLSKGVERWQYLAGILMGGYLAVGTFLGVVWVASMFVFRRNGLPTEPLTAALLMVALATALGAAVALFYSTFLHPILVLLATALTITLPHVLAIHLGQLGVAGDLLLPAYALSAQAMAWAPGLPLEVPMAPAVIALLDAGMFALAAATVFHYRDIAAAVE